MEISVVKIGDSKGIRLSKMLIERYNIKDTIDLILEKDQIVLRPLATPRKGKPSLTKLKMDRALI